MVSIKESVFGYLGSKPVYVYTLENRQGAILDVTNFGARVTGLHVPDGFGRFEDVILGFDDLEGYLQHESCFGGTVGRVANRIRGAAFELLGRRYELAANDGEHHLNGGRNGWDKRLWTAAPQETPRGPAVELRYTSPDGEEGYPGRVEARTVYTLTHDGALIIEMSARAHCATALNMANHTYWNLAGHGAGDVLDHELILEADYYTPADPAVPIGYWDRVKTTPFDFRSPKAIGRALAQLGSEHVGYAHNWVVRGDEQALRPVARIWHPASGRTLSLESNAPGVEFCSGNFSNGALVGKGGHRYSQHAGFRLQTQSFPNAVNVPAWQEQMMLLPDQKYSHVMVHRFSVASGIDPISRACS